MEQLTIIGAEDDRLILADDSGQRFALAIDDVLRSEMRSHGREQRPTAPLGASPRDIQARIRAGLSAEETSELLSVEVEAVRRFEGPVLAEREHVVDRALAVPVVIGSDFDVEENPTFGSAVRAKLADLHASGERWTSWKDESGWTVKLEFTANEVDHDARWSFDPRRSSLSPLNGDATQLSRQGPLPDGLIPRLRALDADTKDDSRFDTSAFGQQGFPESTIGDSGRTAEDAAAQHAPVEGGDTETVDLLEALRRRRGRREAAPMNDLEESAARHPAKGAGSSPVALFDAIGDTPRDDDAQDTSSQPVATHDAPNGPAADQHDDHSNASAPARRKNGRPAMPSWDEIVFGARSDD
ncbi:septation protein SepH [Microbacterium halotolerans]|uniref:septation protein SepH n=1 Tax=Microbacterium halotolerans TaxID=246613 RepID=UPI000E6AB862|nr:septation protein SepH [Microbacterium halotolerans]